MNRVQFPRRISLSRLVRFFRYRVRTVLALLILACLGLAILKRTHPANDAARLKQQVVSMGGRVLRGDRITCSKWYWQLIGEKEWSVPTSIELSGEKVTGGTVRDLFRNPASAEIRYLILRGPGITSAEMEQVRKLGIHELDLRNTKVDDDGLTALSGLPLSELKLEHAAVNNFGDANFPGLSKLTLTGTQLSTAGMRAVGRHNKLWYLELSDTPVSDEGLLHLSGLSELRHLGLSRTNISEVGIKHLVQLTRPWRLQVLQLNGCKISDEGAKLLPQLLGSDSVPLTIGLASTPISDAGLEWLSDTSWRTRLQYCSSFSLDVAATRITNRFLTLLKNLKVEKLSLAHTGVTDEGMVHVKHISDLKDLDLTGTQITDEGLSLMGAPQSLGFLNLSQTQITDRGIAILADKCSLLGLTLAGCHISDQCVKDLARIKSLCMLDVSNTPLTDQGIREYSTRTRDPFILHLKLANTPISNGSIPSINKLRPICLSLAWTNISDDGVCQLRYSNDCTVMNLNLSGCRVSDRSLDHLCACETFNTSLSELSVANTDVSIDGLLRLRSISSTLGLLDVSGLELSESDLEALRLALPGTAIEEAFPRMPWSICRP